MSIPIITLFVVFIAIALRKLLPFHLRIWMIMLVGSLVVLLTGRISPSEALHSIDFNIMGYLFGVFVIGQALEESGYLYQLSYYCFRWVKNPNQFLLLIFLLLGPASALLMNDTLAIMATPVILLIARSNHLDAKPFLLALAYAITIGSVLSPIGNPQNLLIAIKGNLHQPFVHFFSNLAIPTLINLLIAYGFIFFRYRRGIAHKQITIRKKEISNKSLGNLCKLSLFIMLFLIMLKIVGVYGESGLSIKFGIITLISAAPLLILSSSRWVILKKMDWPTLIFFVAMFILMHSVWETGFFQSLLKQSNLNVSAIPVVLFISVIMSQLISNVPLVALYLPVLMHSNVINQQLLVLAVGSTIAGNFLLMGAASNIIIIQNAEKRGDPGFGFFEFALLGIPLGLINLLVYWAFLN